jgi:hypothetical protein
MVTLPVLVHFSPRTPTAAPPLPPYSSEEHSPVPRCCIRPLHMTPTHGGRGPRLHGYCRLMALSQSLSDVTVVALSAQTVPMQGEYVP